MILTPPEIRGSLERARAAFPRFSGWDHHNAIDESYPGFSLWGEYIPKPDEPMPQSFFVTFDTGETSWAGHLSIGKPCYFWSSADCGDANLLDTGPCATLEDAIASLKRQMADLFAALSGSVAEPRTTPGRGE